MPKDEDEVSRVLKLANEYRIPVVPYGGGSGVCGAAIPAKGGISIDLKRMDQILAIDPIALRVKVQPGIVGEILERRLNEAGYTLGHFPSSIYSATLGGYLACRSAGQLSTKYGKIEDMVREMKVCLADGRKVRLSVEEGLNLHELFVGSEGTLGIITEASLQIHPLPEKKKYLAFRFPDLKTGLSAIRHFMQKGLRPAVVRLYDPLDTFLFQFKSSGSSNSPSFLKKVMGWMPEMAHSAFRDLKQQSFRGLLSEAQMMNRVIDWTFSQCLLILVFEGPAWKVDWEFKQVTKVCELEKGKNLGAEPAQRWMKKRYSMGYLMSPLIDQGCFADTMEVATTWSKLDGLYEAVRKALSPRALVMAHFSHAYAEGCSIYFTFAARADTYEAKVKLHREIWDTALKAVAEAEGCVSHHHGIGSLKARAFEQQQGLWMDWFRKVKHAVDPEGILNPGKMGL